MKKIAFWTMMFSSGFYIILSINKGALSQTVNNICLTVLTISCVLSIISLFRKN